MSSNPQPTETWLVPDSQGLGVQHQVLTMHGQPPASSSRLDTRSWDSACGEIEGALVHHSRPRDGSHPRCGACDRPLAAAA